MVPADPEPVMPGSSPDAQEQVAQPRRIPFLAISIALVAIMAGSALFLSGYSIGRRAADRARHAASEEEAFQPFWDTYHAISDRYAGGEVDRTLVVQGAIRGMISALGDPYSAYLTSDEYRAEPARDRRPVRGDRGRDRARRAPDGTEGCSPLGTACHLVVTKPLEGSPAEKAGVKAGDIVVSVDGAALDGLTVERPATRSAARRDRSSRSTVQRGAAADPS